MWFKTSRKTYVLYYVQRKPLGGGLLWKLQCIKCFNWQNSRDKRNGKLVRNSVNVSLMFTLELVHDHSCS